MWWGLNNVLINIQFCQKFKLSGFEPTMFWYHAPWSDGMTKSTWKACYCNRDEQELQSHRRWIICCEEGKLGGLLGNPNSPTEAKVSEQTGDGPWNEKLQVSMHRKEIGNFPIGHGTEFQGCSCQREGKCNRSC